MRIVSLAPSNTEIACELGLEDRLVATTSLCDHEKALEKPSVGGWTTGIDFDKVEELEPDIALTSDDLQDKAVRELEKREIDNLQVKPHTLEEVYSSIKSIGEALGAEERAGKLVRDMRESIEEVELEGTRIYCEEWMEPPMVSGNWMPGLIEAANGSYMIEEGERSREFELQELQQFNPEYIILNVCGAGENISTEEIEGREGWQEIEAVKQGNVFVVDDSLLNRPSPAIVEGIKKIERIVEE